MPGHDKLVHTFEDSGIVTFNRKSITETEYSGFDDTLPLIRELPFESPVPPFMDHLQEQDNQREIVGKIIVLHRGQIPRELVV